jgi:predicted component of type VI protein secretion system
MADARELFERQAAWQAGRRRLSWPEKVRMAEAIRESLVRLRNTRPIDPKTDPAERPKAPPRSPSQS